MAWVCFALSLLSKESALFLLFPLGLYALYRRDWKRTVLMLAVLVPMLGWQIYLRTVHGMVPAGILKIFVSPLDGIFGVAGATLETLASDLSLPAKLVELARGLARWILIGVLFSGIYMALRLPGREQGRNPATTDGAAGAPGGMGLGRLWSAVADNFHLRLAAPFCALSIIFADYYYFWGIFDNVARMFTMLVGALVLLGARLSLADLRRSGLVFMLALSLLSAFVLLRALVMTPVFPHDSYQLYTGPAYETDAVRPGLPRSADAD